MALSLVIIIFCVVVGVLGSIYLYLELRPLASRIGTIRNFRKGTRSLSHAPITYFEICQTDGHVYYAALDGYADDLKENDTIEFWPRGGDSVLTDKVSRKTENPDGTVSRWIDNVYYHGVIKYRVIPAQDASE